MRTLECQALDGTRLTITIQALPRAGGQWEARALGLATWAPEGTCDPGVVPADVIVRLTAAGRDLALDAVEAEIRRRYRVEA